MKEIAIPKIDINTEKVLINEWFVENFDHVEKMTLIAVIETSKTAIDIAAPASGYFFSDNHTGSFVPVDQPLGCIFKTRKEAEKYAAVLHKKKKQKKTKTTSHCKATKKPSRKQPSLISL